MDSVKPKIGIVYLLFYHNKSYIDDMVLALKKITYPKDRLELIIVANPHPIHGSFVEYVENAVLPYSGKELPHVTVLPQRENLGFAAGNNAGASWALDHQCDYVFFHNNDGFFAANAFEPLIQAFESDPAIAAAQSLVLMYPRTNLVNSAGNSFHYLGFGFSDQAWVEAKDLSFPPVKEIDYASGAALMVPSPVIRKYGAWDDGFFMYHEDLEWSFRLRMHGYRIVLVRDSVFYHNYQFSRSIQKFFWMERNRHAVMLMFLKIPTLVLLLPMALLLEIGLWIFTIKNNYVSKRFAVYRYWLKKENWKFWLEKRKKIQSERMISDRELLKHSVSIIDFQDSGIQNPLLIYVGNPIMKFYYWIVVKGLIWW